MVCGSSAPSRSLLRSGSPDPDCWLRDGAHGSQPAEEPPPTDPEAQFSLAIETWKRKPLDLTRRNRVLHSRPVHVSTVTVVVEQPT
jgi:hypothetical protein